MNLSKAKIETHFDVIIIGAGAAGLFCAALAAKRGRSVCILEHQKKVGSKIIISGGGRCNFTNLSVKPECYVSENPHFVKSALARFSPQDFIQLLEQHEIEYYEKTLGQLFCKNSAQNIVKMLEVECEKYGVKILLGLQVLELKKKNGIFNVSVFPSPGGEGQGEGRAFHSHSLVIATGGLSLPKMGATNFGYQIAKQFGLKIVAPKAALDGFVLKDSALQKLSGISLDVILTAGKKSFREKLLITHAGLSGPAALQGSLYWNPGEEIEINLLPEINIKEMLLNEIKTKNKQQLDNFLSQFLPKRFVEYRFCHSGPGSVSGVNSGQNLHAKTIDSLSTKDIQNLAYAFHHWKLKPLSTVGYHKAEVTKGGVSTDELSSKTMECKKVPGLYFIGEVVDVTGWLGGYNFHWAWASAWVAGQGV
ncbi:MAG: NAD(P)/FAD-dependent oxidoreductase [Deltaproteobacteria bacterium]|nr:NAD(P)/FAD-dependent oxidoreductase [Deltaproteobacteria bacterium]